MKSVFIFLIIVLLIAAGIFFFLHKDKTSSTPVDLFGELRENLEFGGTVISGPLLSVDDEMYLLEFSDDAEKARILNLIEDGGANPQMVRVIGTMRERNSKYRDDTDPEIFHESSLKVISVESISAVLAE